MGEISPKTKELVGSNGCFISMGGEVVKKKSNSRLSYLLCHQGGMI